VVNAAGNQIYKVLTEIKTEDFKNIIDANFFANFAFSALNSISRSSAGKLSDIAKEIVDFILKKL
jgi:hypothetical protein